MKKRIRKTLKYLAMFGAALLFIILILYLFIAHDIDERAAKVYTFKAEELELDTTRANLNRGAHLVEIKGCTDCHGKDLAGKVFLSEPGLGLIAASNLTRGAGGLSADYSIQDWINALRHGVNQQGRPLLFMPSHETALLSTQDLSAIIAYCRQLPPVDHALPANYLGPLVKVLTYADQMPLFPVEMIDHEKPAIATAASEVGIAQGAYLAVSCKGCHRDDMQGGDGLAPGMPDVPSITNSGSLKDWNLEQFHTALRTGKKPSGEQMNNEEMPWKMTSKYTDDELTSLYLYLKSL